MACGKDAHAGIQDGGQPVAGEGYGWWPALVAGALALTVYVITLAPGLSFDHFGTDGGDLIAAAYNLGVPHPTGYPTYSLLAWLFSRVPVGTIAYRVNLLSAVGAAGAAALLFRVTQRLLPPEGHPLLLPGATALTLAFSSLLWSQAVISEVYTLLAFFASLLLWLLVRWRTGGHDGFLWVAALVLGLGLGNHMTLIFGLPAAVVLLWPERRRWLCLRVLVPCLPLFLAGLAVYAYLPLAARHQPPVNWGYVTTWERFLWIVTADQYHGMAFGLDPAAMPGRIATWAALLGDQFGWWGLVLALVGGWWWWRQDRSFAASGLLWMGLVGSYAFLYDTYDSHIYLIVPFLLLAMWWAAGARLLVRWLQAWRPAWQRHFLAVVALLPLISLALHWQAADPDDDWEVHAYIYQALETPPADSLIVVRGDRPTFALWYGIYAERHRSDVSVVSGPLLAFIWYREHVRSLYPDLVVNEPADAKVTIHDLVHDLIATNIDRRPVYATDPSDTWSAWFDFIEEGTAPIYRAAVKAP
ncbi:MAG: glycosyltransferase family 117 protein [Anaerolineae bacterium]